MPDFVPASIPPILASSIPLNPNLLPVGFAANSAQANFSSIVSPTLTNAINSVPQNPFGGTNPSSFLQLSNNPFSFMGSSDNQSTDSGDLEIKNDLDPRFQWTEVEPSNLLPSQKEEDNLNEYYDGIESSHFNEIEQRVFSLDMWRAGSDTPTDIGSFRIIAYQYGQINTKKQIFPRQGSGVDRNKLLYKKMIIANQSMGNMERSQILKSNKALHAYFFNDAPEVLSIQGFLKTSSTDPWDVAMVLLWDRLLRGTELARHNGILELAIADVIYWGYPLSFTHQIGANTQFVASFAMQLLIVDKLLPLQNIDQAVLNLTTDFEQSTGFVTTSKSTTNDIVTQVNPITAPEINVPSGDNFTAGILALGQGPLNSSAAIDLITAGPQVPTQSPLSPYLPPSAPGTSSSPLDTMTAFLAPPPIPSGASI